MTSKTTKSSTSAARKTAAPKRPSASTAKSRGTNAKAAPAPPKPAVTKQSQLLALLRSPRGGTIEQMITLTGWQAHTVRGTISGVVRKRLKLNVVTTAAANGGARTYRIVGEQA